MFGGEEFKCLRVRRWLSQSSVAEKVGVTRMTLSKYEYEKGDIPITVLLKWSRLFNVTESELMAIK